MMVLLVALHILAGAMAMLSGFSILFITKGSALHKRVGRAFFYAMLALGSSGAAVATLRSIPLSLLNGLLVCYFVLTSLSTIRAERERHRHIDRMLAGFGAALLLGYMLAVFAARGMPGGMLGGFGVAAYVVFGLVTAMAVFGDLRYLRSGSRSPGARLIRHLWRMFFPLFMATAAFFLGQAKLFPPEIQQSFYIFVPVLLVLGAMLFWVCLVYFSGPAPRWSTKKGPDKGAVPEKRTKAI